MHNVGVRIRTAALLAVALALLSGTAGAGTPRPSLSLAGGVVSRGDRVALTVSRAAPHRRLRLYLAARTTRRLVSVGSVVPGGDGHGRLAVRLPALAADVYAPAARVRGALVTGRGRLSVRAEPPAGFGAPGAPGCAPASPRQHDDVFGTASGAQLWALLGFNPPGSAFVSGDTAAYSGVVGQEVKIVFRMTSGVPAAFYAVAPDGTHVAPAWGPTAHLGSGWARPGREWGAGFVFGSPGCWAIHAGAPPAQGDIWISIRS
ncbi:MAG: hypothetical protein V7644_2014 [Actinomycetota bacterium]